MMYIIPNILLIKLILRLKFRMRRTWYFYLTLKELLYLETVSQALREQ